MRLISSYTDMNGFFPYKGSFHNHTFKNGVPTAAPWVVLGIYRLCGIPIVAVTEHDRRLHLTRRIEDGDAPWREQDWEHPYDDAVLIKGFEASFPQDHVNVLGMLPHELPVQRGAKDFIKVAHEHGAFTILNHPAKWNDDPDHVLKDENLSACQGIEVYNGARARKEPIASTLWDACLTHGLRMWALAGSDCHTYDFTSPSRPTNGWNVLWLRELSINAIFEALRMGRFYASSGLEIDDVQVRDGRVRVRADQATGIRFIGEGGRLLKEAEGTEAEYTPRGDETYVRVEVIGEGVAFPETRVPRMAWLQPIWIEE